MMGMSSSDTSEDAQLALFITMNSETIFRMCNRVFAREEVREEWRELNGGHRIFPSHWPIKESDIESIESPSGTVLDPADYVLEEDSGKIQFFGGSFQEPIIVQYWGGYNLPDEAPMPLKRALALLNLQSKLLGSLGQIAGIRSMAHKEARIQFHDPMAILNAAMGGGGSATTTALSDILSHYIHFEV